MDIRHLQHALFLSEEPNFSRAAKPAHLTRSAFSRSIEAAETVIASLVKAVQPDGH